MHFRRVASIPHCRKRSTAQAPSVRHVMVGEDGHVEEVKVIRSLPDFLTEEAIRAAFEMKFKSAMKDGQAVPFWLPMLVEFNLK